MLRCSCGRPPRRGRQLRRRISRAKQTISGTWFDFSLPVGAERTERLGAVLHVLYLVFNEGYEATAGEALTVPTLSLEAIRLTRWLHRLLPHHGEVTGLLALMLLTVARRPARTEVLATLAADKRMARHHRLLAARGHLRELAGDADAAAADYLDAARRATSLPERRYLALRAARSRCMPPEPDERQPAYRGVRPTGTGRASDRRQRVGTVISGRPTAATGTEATVSEFDNLKNEGEQLAQQHPQQFKEGEDAVEKKFGMGQQDQQGQGGPQDQYGQGQQDQGGQDQYGQGQQDQQDQYGGDQQSGY